MFETIKTIILGVILIDLALVGLIYWQDRELFWKIVNTVRSKLRI